MIIYIPITLKPSGYSFHDFPRQSNRKGGGTGILARDCYNVSQICADEKISFEFSIWLVKWNNTKIKLCIIYRPPFSENHPVSTNTFFTEFEEFLEDNIMSDESLCIVGDFNIHMDFKENPDQLKMNDILTSFGLIQHVCSPTHQSGHILDLILTRNCGDLELSSPNPGYFISDHCFLNTTVNLQRSDVSKTTIEFRKL